MRLVSKNMIGRGLLVLAVMSTCVLSLPLTPSQMENEDVKVMKCIVEALADVLSRPHPVPVSEECLVTLKTDDRLVSILRHHNFLNELQEIAVQGHQERAQRQRDAGKPRPTTEAPQTDSAVADRSMLEALGGPGERSILSQKRRTGNGDGEEVKDESQGEEVSEEADMAGDVQVKRENDKRPRSHSSESSFESSESRAEKREEEKEENEKEGENSVEENMMTTDKKETGSGEKREEPRKASKKKFEEEEEDEDDIDKRSPLFPHKQEKASEEQEDEEEEETTSMESIKRWAKRGKASPLTKKAGEKETHPHSNPPEVPHHSQEASKEEEEKKKREVKKSPEEKELQSIAREGPEERRDLEEEGSASRKSEEPEIESLAAIESELENVAQKLHELRQG